MCGYIAETINVWNARVFCIICALSLFPLTLVRPRRRDDRDDDDDDRMREPIAFFYDDASTCVRVRRRFEHIYMYYNSILCIVAGAIRIKNHARSTYPEKTVLVSIGSPLDYLFTAGATMITPGVHGIWTLRYTNAYMINVAVQTQIVQQRTLKKKKKIMKNLND